MNRMVMLFALAFTAAAAIAADKQQVYKWTDANGVVHFTGTPPPEGTPNVQSVHLVGGMTTADTAAVDNKPKDTPPATSAPPALVAANAADNAALCQKARANLELLQGNAPVGIAGADGKADALDDQARAEQIRNAQLAIAKFCK